MTGYATRRPYWSFLGGLGGPAVEAVAGKAANAAADAIFASGVTGTSLAALRMPDYSAAWPLVRQVADANVASAITGYMETAQSALRNILEYGEEAGINISVAVQQASLLQSIAAGAAPEEVAGDYWTDNDPSAYMDKDSEEISWLQDFAMSDAGAGVIKTGAYSSGWTGINKDAILEEGKRSDIDVAGLISAGERHRAAATSMGKYALYAGAAVLAAIAARKAGLL